MRHDATEAAALGLLGLNPSLDSASTVPLKRKASASSSINLLDEDNHSTSSDSIACICGFTYDDGFSIGCDSCSRWCHAACFGIVETEVPEEWQCWVCSPRPVDKDRAVRLQKARQKAALELDKQKRRVSPGVDRKGRRTSVAAIDGGGGQTKRKRRPSVNVQQTGEDEHVDIDEPWTHSYVPIDRDILQGDTRDKLRRVAAQWRGVTALDSDSSASSSPSTTPALLSPDSYPTSTQILLHPLNKSSFHPHLSTSVDPSLRPPSYAVHAARPIPSSSFITPFTSTITSSATYLSDPLNAYAHLSMPKPFVHLIGPPLDVALDARLTGNQSRFVRSGCRPNAILRPVLCPRRKGAKPMQHATSDGDFDEDTLAFGIFALRDLKANEEVVLGWEWDDGSVIHHLPALVDSPHVFPPQQIQQYRQQLMSMLHTLSSTFATCACGAKARDCALTRIAEFVDGHTPPTPSPSPPSTFVSDMGGWDMGGAKVRGSEDLERVMRTKTDVGPLIGVERGFRTRERVPSGGMTGVEMIAPNRELHRSPGQGSGDPLSSAHTSQRVHMSTQVAHQRDEASAEERPLPASPSSTNRPLERSIDSKGKVPIIDLDGSSSTHESSDVFGKTKLEVSNSAAISSPERISALDAAMDIDHDAEDKLPPKHRKAWIRKSFETLRDIYRRDAGDALAVDGPVTDSVLQPEGAAEQTECKMDADENTFDPKEMPPPPLPQPRSPSWSRSTPPSMSSPFTTLSTNGSTNDGPISPSIPFANLSLLSPISSGRSPYSLHIRSPSSPLATRLDTPESLREHAESHPQRTSAQSDCTTGSSSPAKVSPPSDDHGGVDLPVSDTSAMDFGSPAQPSITMSESPHAHEDVPSTHPTVVSEPSSEQAAGSEIQSHSGDSSQSVLSASKSTLEKPIDPPVPTSVHRDPSPTLPPPPPPSPPKVKLSLKDFALRKKKQREEEMGQTQPSPSIAVVPQTLAVDGASGEDGSKEVESTQPADPVAASVYSKADRHQAATIGQSPTPTSPTENTCERRAELDDRLSANDSLQAKVEMVEESLPSGLPVSDGRARSATPLPPEPPPKLQENEIPRRDPTPQTTSKKATLSHSPIPSHEFSRQVSQEDGEILNSPPSKIVPYPPRSRSPPTHPRSFLSGGQSPSHTPSTRRPLHPPHRTFQTHSSTARPLPSGPRALRTLNLASYPPAPAIRPPSGLPPPRGPSADRDRVEWERERNWGSSSRGRGRGNGASWMR